MQNLPLIQIDESKCTLCYACVRSCPTKAITTLSNSDKIVINHDRCISCGNCYISCGPKAISYQKSYDKLAKHLNSNKKSIAIVDPSIASEFPDILDYRNFVGMIRALGFDFVNEISFGADLVAIKYKELLDNFKGKYFITTSCPPVYEYIEKFQPNIIDSLAGIDSPMTATAKVMREIHGKTPVIVAITPCLAHKKEILRNKDLINEVIGFEELRTMFNNNNVYENSVEFSEFDQQIGFKGSLFPISEGILDAAGIDCSVSDSNIITREGPENFKKNISDFAICNEIKQNLNLYFCNGCIMGPCSSHRSSYLTNRSLQTNFYKKRVKLIDQKEWQKNIDKFINLDFSRSFIVNDQRISPPAKDKIEKVLKLLGKETHD